MPGRPSQFLEWPFPIRGIDRQHEFEEQPALSTPTAVNVRAFEPATDRARGGSRPGIAKFISTQGGGDNVIQHLNVVVDPQAPLLGLSFDADTDTPYADPSSGGRNLLDDGSTRFIRLGGSGNYTHPEADQDEPVGGGEIELVQSKISIQGDTSSPFTVAFDTNPSENNLLVVIVASLDTVTNVAVQIKTAAVLETLYTQAGNYTTIDNAGVGNHTRLSMWYRVAGASGTDEKTLTITPSGISGVAGFTVVIAEYRRTTAASPLDDTSENADSNPPSAAMTTGTITVNNDNSLIIAAFASSNATDTVTPDAGFSEVESDGISGDGNDIQLYVVHKVSQDTDVAAGVTWDGGAQDYCAIGASFKWQGF